MLQQHQDKENTENLAVVPTTTSLETHNQQRATLQKYINLDVQESVLEVMTDEQKGQLIALQMQKAFQNEGVHQLDAAKNDLQKGLGGGEGLTTMTKDGPLHAVRRKFREQKKQQLQLGNGDSAVQSGVGTSNDPFQLLSSEDFFATTTTAMEYPQGHPLSSTDDANDMQKAFPVLAQDPVDDGSSLEVWDGQPAHQQPTGGPTQNDRKNSKFYRNNLGNQGTGNPVQTV